MVAARFFHQLALLALVWLCCMRPWTWPSAPAAVCPTTLEPHPAGHSITVNPPLHGEEWLAAAARAVPRLP